MSAAMAPLKGGALPAGRSLVKTVDGKVFANSLDVAEFFGKAHKNVLRDIDVLIGHGSDLSHEVSSLFTKVKVRHPTVAGRFDPTFDMTRDGFMLLGMGFTGAKALEWKLLYVRAFNAMEATLRAASPAPAAVELTAGDCHRIGGIVKAVTGKALDDRLGPMEDKIRRIGDAIARVGDQAVADPRLTTVEYRPMLEVLVELGVPAKGRRAISVCASARLRRWAIDRDRAAGVRRSRETGKYLFQVELVADWLRTEGRALIAAHRAVLDGQPALPLRSQRRKPAAAGGAA
jgi:Rha family phage regulatory protein